MQIRNSSLGQRLVGSLKEYDKRGGDQRLLRLRIF